VKVLSGDIDEILWPYDSNNSFTIKSFYHGLYNGGDCPDSLANAVCKSEAPTKACFFAWEAIRRKDPYENMPKRIHST